MKTLNFALIGTGQIAVHHAEVIKALGHNILMAISSNKTKNLDAFCDKYDVEYKFNSLKDITIHKNKIDAS